MAGRRGGSSPNGLHAVRWRTYFLKLPTVGDEAL